MASGAKHIPTTHRTHELLRCQVPHMRQDCQICNLAPGLVFTESTGYSCAPTPSIKKDSHHQKQRLDSPTRMLQAIEVGKGIPMLEPWIIDLIRRREEERRKGERSQLELPVPDPRWPEERDPEMGYGELPPRTPERGVVIIGM